MDGKWTKEMVRDRMEEAVRTLRTLRVTGLKPMGYGSNWPDVIHDPNEAFGWNNVEVQPGPPAPDAITRMDESLQWLHWLEPDQARLVWLYADDIPRKMVCARVGMSLSKAWRVWSAAIMIIISMLNKNIKVVQSKENKEDVFLREYRRTGNASAAYRLAFPCKGLSDNVIHARARRLARKSKSSDQPTLDGQDDASKQKTTDENRRNQGMEPTKTDAKRR